MPLTGSAPAHFSDVALTDAEIEFIGTDDARPVRLLVEFMQADLQLQRAQIHSTAVVFGSSQVPSPEAPTNASNAPISKYRRYYEEARALAPAIAARCGSRACNHYVIVTGGGPGIMEAANRGTHEHGLPTVGLNIRLLTPQPPNAYLDPTLTFNSHYSALRKMHFMLRAKALVVFPGGFGTFDELFEARTLVQTGKIAHIPIVLVGTHYWCHAIDLITQFTTSAPA